ncbi:pyocin knob domain-containing protein [Bacillus safensis]|uniref:pyocin knob domain-containing protein n=1 Tax=Bacillus safensis TaxID=561879 RepID=UPI00227E868A|nr:pyocin knob domain-containing protein [Bacillus safensis]MCY7711234.1 pyocin knob domain-containing protein [Bacillus safensis]MCY7727287.1 pyocin knob domain-containing protein [Bacillus safensis]MED0883159.1 pyocin knob domain-containing protein [Bacillus safensis]MED0918445.1 pyocin knob domain-containing protein [Bacillus safensis]
MEIKEPKAFEVNDKAHADLFNDMVKVLLENDNGLLERFLKHSNDGGVHASETEKKKWNDSQSYKITADSGRQLINVSAGESIFDAIKDKGTCTFYAAAGVEDSPALPNVSIRGLQTVGQENIGSGFAIDMSGNAYFFYYDVGHTSLTWTKLPTESDRNRWDNGQLVKITQDNGKPIYHGFASETDYNTLTQTGMYLIYNQGINGPSSFNRVFLLVMSYGTTLVQIAYESVYGKNTYFRVLKHNAESWTPWEKQITLSDLLEGSWETPKEIKSNWKEYDPINLPVKYRKNLLGEVEIVGAVKGGTLGNNAVFNLPEEYRPKQAMHFVGVASSIGAPGVPQFHRTLIDKEGNVCVQSSSNNANPTEFITFGFKFSTR